MRDDQRAKLEGMQEELLDQIVDSGPVKDFPGWESAETRGDRYWFIKIKAAELALYEKIENVLERRGSVSRASQAKEEDNIDKKIQQYEGLVKRALGGGLAEKYRKPSDDPRTRKDAH